MKASTKLGVALATTVSVSLITLPPSLAVPPAIITRQSGNTRVEVRQLSVAVGGDPDAPPTGWGSSFAEFSDLAWVRFQVRIFQNGRLVASENVGPISYRGGDLPELVEVKNLDRDRDLEIRIHFRGYEGGSGYRILSEFYYDWRANRGKYYRTVTLSSREIGPSVVKSGFL